MKKYNDDYTLGDLILNAQIAYRSMDEPEVCEADFIADLICDDVARVVRCRDCYRNSDGVCRIAQLEMKPDDFCSYGVRKE